MERAWIYEQATGFLFLDGKRVLECYAGHGEGLNNPLMQDRHALGPLPCGFYTIHEPHTGHTGPYSMFLEPDAANEMFGRSAFYLHGDNPRANHTASDGCIVKSPASDRAKVWNSGVHRLQVVAHAF